MDNATAPVAESKVIEYRLNIKGLFGRNRKVKFDSVLLRDQPVEAPLNEAQVEELARAKAVELKAKPDCRISVSATEVTVKREGGFTSRSFMMFSGKTVFQAVL